MSELDIVTDEVSVLEVLTDDWNASVWSRRIQHAPALLPKLIGSYQHLESFWQLLQEYHARLTWALYGLDADVIPLQFVDVLNEQPLAAFEAPLGLNPAWNADVGLSASDLVRQGLPDTPWFDLFVGLRDLYLQVEGPTTPRPFGSHGSLLMWRVRYGWREAMVPQYLEVLRACSLAQQPKSPLPVLADLIEHPMELRNYEVGEQYGRMHANLSCGRLR